jgi:hypothetical protein
VKFSTDGVFMKISFCFRPLGIVWCWLILFVDVLDPGLDSLAVVNDYFCSFGSGTKF